MGKVIFEKRGILKMKKRTPGGNTRYKKLPVK
jgi:hypothetical protein